MFSCSGGDKTKETYPTRPGSPTPCKQGLSKDVEKNPGPTQYNTDHHEVIIRPFMQNHSSTMQLISPISSENLMQSRLGELGLQSIDVGGAGDCFFRSVSHQLCGNSKHHMHIHTAGVQFMRDNPER